MLGERLKELRKTYNYSQQQLAIKLHLTQGAISQWENGLTEPAAEQLISIAEVYGISVDEVLGIKKKEPIKKEHANLGALNDALIEMLLTLSPSEVQRVQDFVAGMKATEKA